MFEKIKNWLRGLRKQRVQKSENAELARFQQRQTFKEKPIFEPEKRSVPIPQQDIGRFMKHGRQAPWYRKSVKAKVKPKKEIEDA